MNHLHGFSSQAAVGQAAIGGRTRRRVTGAAFAAVLVGLATAGAAHAETSVEIGMAMGLTGYLAAFDGPAVDGAKLAMKHLKDSGGGTTAIRLNVLDNASNATTAVTAVNQLINKYDVKALISGASSAGTLAVEPIAARDRVPVITMSIIPPSLQWTFSIASPPGKVLEVQLAFAKQKFGAKRIAFLYSQTPYGQTGAKLIADVAARMQIEVTFIEGVETGATDLTPQLAKLKDAGPDAVLDFLTGPVHLVEAKAAVTVGLGVPIIMGIDDSTIDAQAAGIYPNCFHVASPVQVYPDVPDPQARASAEQFLTAFRAAGLDERVVNGAASGWDMVHMMAAALSKSGATSGPDLRQALMHLDHAGALGRFQFRAEDHTGQANLPASVQIARWTDGHLRVVAPGAR